MLLVAYLDRPSVAGRPLNADDGSLLYPMITHSDNTAATTVDGIVGNNGLSALARRVGMTNFTPVADPWGETQITARDQTRFFLHVDEFVVPRHRAYAMHLLASITPSQRWGIGEVAPHGWQLYFKGGWGYGTGLLDHQVVLLTRGCARVSLAVLTMYDGSHAYGKATLRGIFSRLLHGFPTGAPLYPVTPGARYSGPLVSRGGARAGTFSFTAGHDGEALHDVTARLTGSPTCGSVTEILPGPFAVDPRGRFVVAAPAAAVRTALSFEGRFAAPGSATGTLQFRNLAVPGCAVAAAWTVHAAR